MDNIKEQLNEQLEIVKEEAREVIKNADQYSKDELTDLRETISEVIQNAEEKLKAYKEKQQKRLEETS